MKNYKLNKRITALIISCFFLIQHINAQNEWNQWVFGNGAIIDFNGGGIGVAISPNNATLGLGEEGVASICDASGDLLMYTDGIKIWNKNHNPIASNIGGDYSSTQSGIIVPDPGNAPGIKNQYYVFAVDAISNGVSGTDKISYTIVDFLGNPSGVVQPTVNLSNISGITEKVTAVKRPNGNYWIITHLIDNNSFIVYDLNQSGLVTIPTTYNVGSVHNVSGASIWEAAGYLKVSHDGTKIACVIRSNSNATSRVELFDFDVVTGVITNSNPIVINGFSKLAQGVEFSPDNSKLYISCGNSSGNGSILYGYDLSPYNNIDINNSKIDLTNAINSDMDNDWYGALQLAPDGNIYLAKKLINNLAAITNPNVLNAVNYIDNYLSLGTNSEKSQLGLPNFIQAIIPNSTIIETCYEEDVVLNAGSGTGYSWTPTTGLSSSTIQNPTVINPQTNITYEVNYTNLGNPETEFFDIVIVPCCLAATDPEYVQIITDPLYNSDQIWNSKYYIADNVIVTVTDGAFLDITNVDVVFGECAGIKFESGAYLRSNNSVFRSCAVDGTWKGLTFDNKSGGTIDNIINQTTFKNAEVALYFKNGADGVITDNLFSNCYNGVRVESNNNFDHSITGNRFVLGEFYPSFPLGGCYSFATDATSFGIVSTTSRFLKQVSQNEFVNSKGVLFEAIGIHQTNGGGIFTSNTFTDYTSAITSITPLFYTGIENNKIEVNVPGINTFASSKSIFIDDANGALVEINNNEISNNENQFPTFMAIAAKNSSNLSIAGNEIEGFNYGIDVFAESHNYIITQNSIKNTRQIGIIAQASGEDQNFITCNEVKMKNFNNTIGIHMVTLSQNSEVTSNCISDCETSMNFENPSSTLLPLPLIRNNYLYNYNVAGINVINHSGNIGTGADPGMNTLWSNNFEYVADIQSNTSITVADNFGMTSVSFPQVQVDSYEPIYSTASCGSQIYGTQSQTNLNVDYNCEKNITHADKALLIGSAGTYDLSNNYLSKLKNSINQYDDANMVLANYNDADVSLLNTIINNTTLTKNEQVMLKYHFFYRSSDYTAAESNLNLFNPNNEDEVDFKTLRKYDVDIINSNWSILTTNDIQILENIKSKKSVNSNFAVSLLNNTATYRDYIFDVPKVANVTKATDVISIGGVESYLNIYPNPSSSNVYIELVSSSLDNEIQLIDLTGKIIENYSLNIVAGRIELDISDLSNGVYFITLTNPETGILQKGKIVKMAE